MNEKMTADRSYSFTTKAGTIKHKKLLVQKIQCKLCSGVVGNSCVVVHLGLCYLHSSACRFSSGCLYLH